jgi:hypothetical protein
MVHLRLDMDCRRHVHCVGVPAPIVDEIVPPEVLRTGVPQPRIRESIQVPQMQVRVYDAGDHELTS